MHGDGQLQRCLRRRSPRRRLDLHGARSHKRVVFAGKSPMCPVFQMLTAIAEPVSQPHVLRACPVDPPQDMEASHDFLRGGFSCGSAADHISKRQRIDDQPGDDRQRRFDKVTAARANFLQNNMGFARHHVRHAGG